jgi:hypothetical protein
MYPTGSRRFHISRYGDLTHEQAFVRTSIEQLCLSCGFSRVNVFEDRPVPHGLKSAVRAVLWRLIRAGLLFYVAVETGRDKAERTSIVSHLVGSVLD